jgi:hypothetical protein
MMDSRDIFLVAALLSAGTVLRFILVLFGETITPNVMVAFYCLAIMLVVPSFGETIGIGLVSGIIAALISQSLNNTAFLLSEPLGAAVCLLVFITLRYYRRVAPYIAVIAATITSGVVFAVLTLSLASSRISEEFGTPGNFLALMTKVIIATVLVNVLIAGLIYPALVKYRDKNPG